jgi:hypothetical protein
LLIYAVTIAWSALLLFLVQPLISRFILPWFGGSPAVWSTSLLFFQVLLLGGYIYAHLLIRRLAPRAQVLTHLVLLAVAVAMLPIAPDPSWKPVSPEEPRREILLLLTVAVGLPYFVLSTTGPLLQAWFARDFPGSSPYRLYALSNLGSLIGLLGYPFVVEPLLALRAQAWVWSAGFVLFAVGAGACAWRMRAFIDSGTQRRSAPADSPRPRLLIAWVVMAAIPSILLLATTNQMCQDVAVVPFLWVLPLSLYLISLVICFDSERWYTRQVYWTLTMAMLLLTLVALQDQIEFPVLYEIAIYAPLLFCGSMVCHGELARVKPQPEHLTSFYLCLSIGGAMGGVFVNLVAPLIFDAYLELHTAMLAVVVLGLLLAYWDPGSRVHRGRPIWASLTVLAVAAGFGWQIIALAHEASADFDTVDRNFYGIVRTYGGYDGDFDDDYRILIHGRVDHGFQYQSDSNRGLALAYYGPDSGADLAFRHHQPEGGRRIGVVGLGVGTLAALAVEGDEVRFYEINPVVDRLARERFSFLADTPAKWSITLGDARLSLERELEATGGQGHDFDILVLDAFSGDAPPTHLITLEAVELYQQHMADQGLMVFNISNRHVDLSPVLWGIAEELGLEAVLLENWEDLERGIYSAWWMVLTRNRDWISHPDVAEQVLAVPTNETRPHEGIELWTDDYSNLVELLLLWESEDTR